MKLDVYFAGSDCARPWIASDEARTVEACCARAEDACMLAAAPEMLAALKLAWTALRNNEVTTRVWMDIWRAIAKAEGRGQSSERADGDSVPTLLAALAESIRLAPLAIAKFGDESQERICIEEIGELLAAMMQLERGRVDLGDVMVEVADVLITVLQAGVMHGGFDVLAKNLEEKNSRLRRLLESE